MAAASTGQGTETSPELTEIVPGQIWKNTYFFKTAGMVMPVNTTIVKLRSGKLCVISPGSPLSAPLRSALTAIGDVDCLVAPNDAHYLNIGEWQAVYQDAKTYLTPGVEKKVPGMKYTKILSEQPEPEWEGDFTNQALVRGKNVSEMLFLHGPSKSLIATDLVMHITDKSQQTDRQSSTFLTNTLLTVLRMKNRATLPPGWKFADKVEAKHQLNLVINEWKPERVIVGHGENIEGADNVSASLKNCWASVLAA